MSITCDLNRGQLTNKKASFWMLIHQFKYLQSPFLLIFSYIGTSKKTVYDYPNLNSYLVSFRNNLKAYYKSHITDKMFKYELLK